MATHSSTFAWKIPWAEDPQQATIHGVGESDTTKRLHFLYIFQRLQKPRWSERALPNLEKIFNKMIFKYFLNNQLRVIFYKAT